MPEFAVAPPEPAVVDRIARAAIENAIWLLKELPLDLTGPLKAEIAEHGRPACDPHALMGAVWQRIKNSEITYRLPAQTGEAEPCAGTGAKP